VVRIFFAFFFKNFLLKKKSIFFFSPSLPPFLLLRVLPPVLPNANGTSKLYIYRQTFSCPPPLVKTMANSSPVVDRLASDLVRLERMANGLSSLLGNNAQPDSLSAIEHIEGAFCLIQYYAAGDFCMVVGKGTPSCSPGN